MIPNNNKKEENHVTYQNTVDIQFSAFKKTGSTGVFEIGQLTTTWIFQNKEKLFKLMLLSKLETFINNKLLPLVFVMNHQRSDLPITKQILFLFLSIYLHVNLKSFPPLRGIGKTCTEAKTKGFKRLVGSSGGNAGLAMAYAANQLKMPLTLFIPKVCSYCFIHNNLELNHQVTEKSFTKVQRAIFSSFLHMIKCFIECCIMPKWFIIFFWAGCPSNSVSTKSFLSDFNLYVMEGALNWEV